MNDRRRRPRRHTNTCTKTHIRHGFKNYSGMEYYWRLQEAVGENSLVGFSNILPWNVCRARAAYPYEYERNLLSSFLGTNFVV